MAGKGGAIAVGLADGILRGLEIRRKWEAQDEDRKAREEDRAYVRGERDRVTGDRVALQNAAKPVTVDNGATVTGLSTSPTQYDNADVAASDLRQNQQLAQGAMPSQDGGGTGLGATDGAQPALADATMTPTKMVAGKAYSDQGSAAAAAAAANTPEARDARVAQALRERGNVTGAMQYEASSRQSQVSGMDLADRKWNQQVRQAMTRGHQGLAEMMTNTEAGPFAGKKVQAVPSQDGKSVTYSVVNEDGSLTPTRFTFPADQNGVVQAGYTLAQIDPEVRYKHMVADDKQAAAVTQKQRELELKQRQLEEVQIPNAETRSQLAEVKAQLADLKAKHGDGTVSREERMKYTTLFTDAGRRMQDAQKALNTMRQDRGFMRRAADPKSSEAQQLQEVQSNLKSHTEERELYRGLLDDGSRSKGSGNSKPDASATPAPALGGASSTKVPPATQAARDSDRVKILNDELAKANERLAAGDTRAQGDVDAITRELSGSKVRLSNATPKTGAAQAQAGPVKVATKAERDKLDKGTRYIGPDGQTYVKQ